jgi:hypothetical protein
MAIFAVVACFQTLAALPKVNSAFATRQTRMPPVHVTASGVGPVPAPTEVKPPPAMYANSADVGAGKANQSILKTLILGILSGCHIGLGKES